VLPWLALEKEEARNAQQHERADGQHQASSGERAGQRNKCQQEKRNRDRLCRICSHKTASQFVSNKILNCNFPSREKKDRACMTHAVFQFSWRRKIVSLTSEAAFLPARSAFWLATRLQHRHQKPSRRQHRQSRHKARLISPGEKKSSEERKHRRHQHQEPLLRCVGSHEFSHEQQETPAELGLTSAKMPPAERGGEADRRLSGSEQEFEGKPISSGFPENDEIGFGDGHALSLEEQVA
jgi:hypothetical protein